MQNDSKLDSFNQNDSKQNLSSMNRWVVLKFGGSSVGEAKNWRIITQQIKVQISLGLRPLLVLSALKNVSNLLEGLLHQALAGVHPVAIEHIKELHQNFSAQLGLDVEQYLSPWFESLEEDCCKIRNSRQITPELHARVLSIGELLSTTIGNLYLNKHLDCYENSCAWLDARKILKATNKYKSKQDFCHHFTSAECDYQFDPHLIARLERNKARVIVTQGFIGSDDNNETVLLGREGSDTSAAYFGSKMSASEVQIWTDVPGVFSCNPQENNQARQLVNLNYSDAKLMAEFGAKVLHARAIQPMFESEIPIWVKSTHLPEECGTKIDNNNVLIPQIKAIVSEHKVVLIKYRLQESKANSKKSDIGTAIQAILLLGFDLILSDEVTTYDKYETIFVLRYSNSDKAQPDASIIIDTIQQNSGVAVTCIENYSLISVIGLSAGQHWKSRVQELCSKQSFSDQIHLSLDKGRISLLVPEQLSQKLEKFLHRELIETSSSEYGDSWINFLPS